MLTLKLISEETERVIKGLEKKHFKGAKEAIDNVLAIDKKRREAQVKLDKNKQEANGLFDEKFDDIDMISFGPDIRNAHTPEEMVNIASIERVWNYFVEVMKATKENY